ncbi:hypothetical protein [Microbacterium sp. HJ5]
MRTPTFSRRIAALTLAAVAVFGLAGCTGFPAGSGTPAPSTSSTADGGAGAGSDDGTQTTAEACQLVQDTITDATAEFEQATTDDPAAVAEAFQAAAQSIADATGEVSNEEVAALLPPLQDVFERVAEVLPAIIEGDTSRTEEFQELGADLQTSMEQFNELCTPAE